MCAEISTSQNQLEFTIKYEKVNTKRYDFYLNGVSGMLSIDSKKKHGTTWNC